MAGERVEDTVPSALEIELIATHQPSNSSFRSPIPFSTVLTIFSPAPGIFKAIRLVGTSFAENHAWPSVGVLEPSVVLQANGDERLASYTPFLSISSRQRQSAVAPKPTITGSAGELSVPGLPTRWLQFDGVAGVQGGILKHRRTNLPSTTDEGIDRNKKPPNFSGAVNSHSASTEGA